MRRAILIAAWLASCACQDGTREDHFLDPCVGDSDCPGGWTCPVDGEPLTGEVEGVCTPSCHTSGLCEEILERSDVFCYLGGFCAIECSSHDDCPEELPWCRGSDPSCAGEVDQPWCAKEDYVCTP
jgi:hypothetical protein